MATKAENAKALSDALGVTVNPDPHTAAQLEGWVARLDTELDTVQAEVTGTAPAALEVVKPVPDGEGNEWTVRKVAAGTEVTCRTVGGRQVSTTAPTEDEARASIRAHLGLTA